MVAGVSVPGRKSAELDFDQSTARSADLSISCPKSLAHTHSSVYKDSFVLRTSFYLTFDYA